LKPIWVEVKAMEIVGYFQNLGSLVYHIVYEVSAQSKTPKGFPRAWTLCGLRPNNREGTEDIMETAPKDEGTRLCINCQAVQGSGMVRIKEFEAFLNRTPTRATHPQCFGNAAPYSREEDRDG
jgi:hypothetical protein